LNIGRRHSHWNILVEQLTIKIKTRIFLKGMTRKTLDFFNLKNFENQRLQSQTLMAALLYLDTNFPTHYHSVLDPHFVSDVYFLYNTKLIYSPGFDHISHGVITVGEHSRNWQRWQVISVFRCEVTIMWVSMWGYS